MRQEEKSVKSRSPLQLEAFWSRVLCCHNLEKILSLFEGHLIYTLYSLVPWDGRKSWLSVPSLYAVVYAQQR